MNNLYKIYTWGMILIAFVVSMFGFVLPALISSATVEGPLVAMFLIILAPIVIFFLVKKILKLMQSNDLIK